MPARLDRRALLVALAAAPFGTLPGPLRAQALGAGLIAGNVCLVQRETTAGPFYLDPGLVRRDITEGRPGAAMTLRLQIVTAGCAPIRSARVDVWHCDAAGAYSGVRSAVGDATGATFLRGTQVTGTDGVARFQTICPGWYPGRAPHVHYRVFLAGRTILTGQLFFDPRVTEQVYAAHPAYRPRGVPDTPNAADRTARRAGEAAIARVTRSTDRLDAALVIGLRA